MISNQFLVFPTNLVQPAPLQVEIYQGIQSVAPQTGHGGWNASGAGSVMDIITATNQTNFIARMPNIVGYGPHFGFNTNFQSPNGGFDNYLGRAYAYFIPPSSGTYKFYGAVDDSMQLLMNTNAANNTDPAGAVVVGQIINYGGTAGVNQNVGNGIFNLQGGSGVYNLLASNITLTANQRYYTEVRWREGGGGDGFRLAVRAQGDSTAPTGGPGVGAEVIPASMMELATNGLRYGPIILGGLQASVNGGPAATVTSLTVNEGDVITFNAVNMSGAGSWLGSIGNIAYSTSTAGGANTVDAVPQTSIGLVWLKGGTDLAKNQVFSSQMYYVTQPITYADNGTTISLLVSNTFSMATQTVNLTVIQDLTPPTIATAYGSPYGNTITLEFSETVDALTSQLLANYSIAGLQIYSVQRDDVNRRRVNLRTSVQTPGQVYTVVANGVRDVAGNATVNAMKNFTAWGTGGIGTVYVELYTNIGFTTINGFLQTDQRYLYNMPDITYYTNKFSIGPNGFTGTTDGGLHFAAGRVIGLFTPPTNGQYQFYVRGDDSTQLYMNTNGPDPAGRTLIARSENAGSGTLNGISGYATGNGLGNDPSRTGASASPILSLTNGTRYWLEALWEEGTGGAYLQVVYAGGPFAANGLPVAGVPAVAAGAEISGGLFSAPGNPDVIQFNVVSAPPAELTVPEYTRVDLALVANVIPASLASGVLYTWQKSNSVTGTFTNIGVTGPTLTLYPPRSDDGATYRVVASLPGTTRSFNTLLHITCDNGNGPQIVSASTLDGIHIGVRFNEPLDPGTGNEGGNFRVYDENGNSLTDLAPSAAIRESIDPRTVIVTLVQGALVGKTFTIEADQLDRSSAGCGGPYFNTSSSTGTIQNLQYFDVGAPLQPGNSYSDTNGTVEVTAGGADIWGTSDQGHLSVGPRSGNFDVWTRVQSLRVVSAPASIEKAGVMVRETTNADSRTIYNHVEPPAAFGGRDIYEAHYRTNAGAASGPLPFTSNPTPGYMPNAWVRLKRTGFIYSLYWGTNGVDWNLYATNHAYFPRTVYVGLATTAHNNAAPATLAVYKDIHIPNPPTITTQPSPASQTIALHGSTSYTVVGNNPANSGALVYQWYLNDMAIAGATSATYSIPDTLGADAGVYKVSVGNDGGDTFSVPVTLNVGNGLPTSPADSLTVTQNTARTVAATTLTANDTDPEGAGVTLTGVSGMTPVTIATNFNAGGLIGSAVYGLAVNDTTNGFLRLHNNALIGSAAGSMVINEITPGKRVGGFSASFKLLLGDGSGEPADGFSFNFGPDMQDTANTGLGENGVGTGFSFCVDNYRFATYPAGGTANTSGIKIRYGGADIAGVQTPTWNREAFVPVSINVRNDGTVTVFVDGTNVFGTLTLPSSLSTTGRFGLYARDGGEREACWLDDLSITVLTRDTAGGGAVSMSPGGNVTYTPPTGVCAGTDTFYYLANDGQVGGTAVLPVTANIVELNPVAPTIVTCATNRTVISYTNEQYILGDLRGELAVSDTCGTPTVSQTPAPGAMLPEGMNTVTFIATDATSLSSTCSISVVVQVVRPFFIAGSPSYGGGIFSAAFQTANGVNYRVEKTDSLNPTAWTLLTTIVGDGTAKSFTDPGPLPPIQRFYRVVPTP